MYDVVFDEILASSLTYISQPYAELMSMRPSVSFIPYATSSKEQNGNIITLIQIDEGRLLSENRNNIYSGN